MRVQEATITFSFVTEDYFDLDVPYYILDGITNITIRATDGSPCDIGLLLTVAARIGSSLPDVDLTILPREIEKPQEELDTDLRGAFRKAMEHIFPETCFSEGDTVTVDRHFDTDGVLTHGTFTIAIDVEKPKVNYGLRYA